MHVKRASLDSSEVIGGYLDLEVSGRDMMGFPASAKVVGALTFSGAGGRYESTLPLLNQGHTQTLILHVAQSAQLGIFTGLALLNAADTQAQVTVKVYAADGTETGEKRLTIPAGTRVVDLLSGATFFGPDFEQVDGHIDLDSSVPLLSFALFGDMELEYLAAIEGQESMVEGAPSGGEEED